MTLAQIRARATPQSFARGEAYYRNDTIFDTVRRGNILEGRCQGSDYAPYHVHVTLDENGDIESASCTCPYDWGGDCKHIVALLLTYLHEPERFQKRTPLQAALAKRSKEQLITLIQQMVERYPDLHALIDRPVPSQRSAGQAVDTEPFRRELRRAINTAPEWGNRIAEQTVRSIANTARQFELAGDRRSACTIYRTIVEESLIQGHYPTDDEGEFVAAVDRVLEELIHCLEYDEIAQNDDERRAVLDCLLHAYIWDIDMGGIGLGEALVPKTLLKYVKPQEVPAIRERIEAAQRRKASTHHWYSEAYEKLLMQLDALDQTEPEVVLQRLREKGLYLLLFEKLISLGRLEEAIAVVSEHLTEPYERLQALPRLCVAGHEDMVIRLAQETLGQQFFPMLATWLEERYTERGDQQALLALRRQCMRQSPSEAYYAALKQTAEALGVWEEVRPQVLRQLEQEKRYDGLIRAYLHDEEWDAAWETLTQVTSSASGWMRAGGLAFEVAERSRHARPDKAIPIYVARVRREIEGRQRTHYAQAAQYLSIVRDLYRQLGDEKAWVDLISGIRGEFRQLRALQDELNKAGL